MPQVRISVEAEEDIDRIAAYTTSKWRPRQTDRYLATLEDGFNLVAQNPAIGRPCDSIRAGLQRFEIGRHVVFYLVEPGGVLVVRILHQNMLPSNYI
ncbi:MAG: type II toxin-antitoxin system RelE/ParE family toxin [Acidobacteriota bacterium]|nr:type II toxin-antitoxin system RelE/ParE family toxin [Acidobacteriota bacterium]